MPFLVDGQNRFFAPRGKIDFRDPFRFHAFLLQKRPQKWGQKSKLGFKNRFLFLLFFTLWVFPLHSRREGLRRCPALERERR